MPDHEYAQYWFSPKGKSIGINDHIAKFCYDEAYTFYSHKLKTFILSCVFRLSEDGTPIRADVAEFESAERDYITFAGRTGKHMYHHPVLHIRYLTFSGRLELDVLLKGTSFMVHGSSSCTSPSPGPQSAYRYGQIVEIFTVRIQRSGNLNTELLDILFVRWYEVDNGADDSDWPGEVCPHSPFCPGRLRFVSTGEDAFGFLRPADILRKVSVVPDVTRGFTTNNLGPSYARGGKHSECDYKFYRVECSIDHDLSMRLHCKPSTYYLLRALEAPSLQPNDVLRAVPWFLVNDHKSQPSTSTDINTLEQRNTSPYHASTMLELANICDIREDNSSSLQGYFQ